MISKRIKNLTPSATLSLDAKVKNLKSKGIDVINLGLGEPDFQTPQNIKEAAKKAIDKGFTHYTQTDGIKELREAISKKYLRETGVLYKTNEIIVGTGSKQLLYSLFQTILDKGDEVIFSLPTWNTYVEQVKLAEGKPVFVKLKPPFKLTLKDLKEKINKKTKAILLNTPSNPTGAVIEKSELLKIANFAKTMKILIICDEIYKEIIYGKKSFSIVSLNKKIKENTVLINGVSKAYAMTGWRIGFALGPEEIINGMNSLQGQMTSNASSIGQYAALEAVSGDQKSVKEMASEFSKRRSLVLKELSSIKGLGIIKPEGAFYFFVSIEDLLNNKYPISSKWCESLLEKEKIAVVPGEAFLYPGYFRLSFTAPEKELKRGIERIKKFVESK